MLESGQQDTKDLDAKCKQKNRGKKRKRVASETSTDEDVLPENTLEVEKSLHASAIKNNLDDISVKKILKKVVTNDHVLALVKLREEEEDSGTEESLQPKLTRAKAKELMKVSPKSAPWNLELTPIKHIPVKTRPEVKALIAQELPEDEDDDEYEPTHEDVPSDDDHVLESSSDIDSLPRTPATPRSQGNATPKIVTDGPFKVPQEGLTTPGRRKLELEEPTIALRTRSKLSLSSTSIEHIESSFVPPDDLPMPDVDSLWNEFLKDCLNPASNARNEDDDETDPEYNVAADPDANEEDEESLENSIIKISKKELNDLVTELFSIMPDGTTEQLADGMVEEVLAEQPTNQQQVPTRWEGKQEPVSDEDNTDKTASTRAAPIAAKRERFSIGKSEPQDYDKEETPLLRTEDLPLTDTGLLQEIAIASAPAPSLPKTPEPRKQKSGKKQPPSLLLEVIAPKPQPIRIEIKKGDCTMIAEQRLLLQQQLRQHVQLATSSFLQLFVHPTHWARAPTYKDFLTALNKMVEKNPSSVVNVCNLKPAIDLVTGWETAVSSSTEENIKMVEFIQKEMERSRRRSAQNAYYVGDFPELFLQVVSNSTVFVYPYLLPAMPFRPDHANRRSNYLRAEDELITLGLDQFWDYVLGNPDLFKPPAKMHPRHRWGLAATLQLVCKHMMPWLLPKTLLAHVRHARRVGDKDNPIFKFFSSRKVEPVKHRLLPFNPQLTLYEQPEHELPRIWLRHLAKSSKRFKKHLHSRNKMSGTSPQGVDIETSMEATQKEPLPIDFIKEINCCRLNVVPKKPDPPLVHRIDVPISAATTATSMCQPMVASEIYTVISTSTGSFLVPLTVQTNTVNSTAAPISTPKQDIVTVKPPDENIGDVVSKDSDEIEGTKTAERSNPTNLNSDVPDNHSKEESGEHCSCCVLLRKICKRQKTIVDYFKRSSERIICDCVGRRYPRMTNRLRLLLKNYKIHSQCIFNEMQDKIKSLEDGIDSKVDNCSGSLITDDSEEHDLLKATLFQLKLTTLTSVVRNNFTKRRIHTLFSKFDVDRGEVLTLTWDLYRLCEEELMQLYKEFVGFLTAEQADKLGLFKDYFIQCCMEKLVRQIEELVHDKEKQWAILMYLKSKFFSTFFNNWLACDICTALLQMTHEHPTLARHVFDMFPHRHVHSNQKHNIETPSETTEEPAESNQAVDYEADHSASGEDGVNEEVDRSDTSITEQTHFVNAHENILIKIEEEEIRVRDVSKTAAATETPDTPDTSRLVMCEDATIKPEWPEWKRDEDKVILEVLKEHIVPEERSDKTILEILEETQVLTMISDSLTHKSTYDVKERILYLLHLLVSGGP